MNSIKTAERLYEEGNYLGSLDIVLKVLENEPNNVRALELKASLCLIEGRESEALRACKKLLRFFGNDDDVWAQLFLLNDISRSYRCLENFDQAIRYCEKSIKLCERFLKVDSPQKEGFLEALVGKLWILGEYQYKIRKYSRAIDTYKKLLRILSEFGCLETIADALFELASNYYKLNRTTEALGKFSEALEIYEVLDNTYALYCRSKVHCSIGAIRFDARDYKEAYFHVEKCLLYLEKVYGEIKNSRDVEDDYTYKEAKGLQDSLRRIEFLWEKKIKNF